MVCRNRATSPWPGRNVTHTYHRVSILAAVTIVDYVKNTLLEPGEIKLGRVGRYVKPKHDAVGEQDAQHFRTNEC